MNLDGIGPLCLALRGAAGGKSGGTGGRRISEQADPRGQSICSRWRGRCADPHPDGKNGHLHGCHLRDRGQARRRGQYRHRTLSRAPRQTATHWLIATTQQRCQHAALMPDLHTDLLRDLTPGGPVRDLAELLRRAGQLVGQPAYAEYVAAGQVKPRATLADGSAGIGSTPHLGCRAAQAGRWHRRRRHSIQGSTVDRHRPCQWTTVRRIPCRLC